MQKLKLKDKLKLKNIYKNRKLKESEIKKIID
jgi:hypothetical protein